MKLFCTSNMVIINACLSYFDFRLPNELLLERYEKYLVKKRFVIVVAVNACRCWWAYYVLCESTNYSAIYELYEL